MPDGFPSGVMIVHLEATGYYSYSMIIKLFCLDDLFRAVSDAQIILIILIPPAVYAGVIILLSGIPLDFFS